MNIERVLDALGIEYVERGANGQGLCPMHEERTGKEDHNPSWFVHLETGQHICFSCGYKGNLLQLVCDINKFYQNVPGDRKLYDYGTAETWVHSSAEVTVEELQRKLTSLPTYVAPPPKPIPMSEARLAVFTQPPQDALDARSVTAKAASYYSVLWDTEKKNWILPLRDPHFYQLMGWQEKGTVNRTFFNRPAGLQKSKTLFGLDKQSESVAIVVESPLDCLRIYSAGYEGAVATCGAIVSEEQAKLLRYSDKVIAAFDNPNLDKAGKKASDQMRIWARKFGLNLFFFNYGDSGKKDPGDMTNEEIQWGIENAKSAILGESAYVYRNPQAVSN